MRIMSATIAALGFVGAVLAANTASAQVTYDRSGGYYGGRYESFGGPYAYDRGMLHHYHYRIPAVR